MPMPPAPAASLVENAEGRHCDSVSAPSGGDAAAKINTSTAATQAGEVALEDEEAVGESQSSEIKAKRPRPTSRDEENKDDEAGTSMDLTKDKIFIPLEFGWDQNDSHVKIYVDFKAVRRDHDNPAAAPLQIRFHCPDEWTAILTVSDRFACKIPNLCHRIDTSESYMKEKKPVLDKGVVLYLRKKEFKNHWFNLQQKRG
ncbi:unnamed protein product [Amoebophrya sp. A120]|nr:unnamed protein product [Amoebophrya sp. A120]|eukprot:GSA120T00010562001.1